MSQAKQAVRLLRWLLDTLEPYGLAPNEQAVIRRMMDRALELREVYEKILDPNHVIRHDRINCRVYISYRQGWPSAYTQEEFDEQLDMERVRLFQVIVGSAPIVTSIAPKRREAIRSLPALLDKFGRQAKALADTLEQINEQALQGDLSLPDWFAYDPESLLHVASWVSGPNSYDSIARRAIDALMVRYSSHVPDIQAMLDALATVDRRQMEETEASHFEFKRQANPMGDFARTLLNGLDTHWRAAVFLKPFAFTATELVQLATVCLDIPDSEMPEEAERRMREVIQERGEPDL